jgi:hypothetical protein
MKGSCSTTFWFSGIGIHSFAWGAQINPGFAVLARNTSCKHCNYSQKSKILVLLPSGSQGFELIALPGGHKLIQAAWAHATCRLLHKCPTTIDVEQPTSKEK